MLLFISLYIFVLAAPWAFLWTVGPKDQPHPFTVMVWSFLWAVFVPIIIDIIAGQSARADPGNYLPGSILIVASIVMSAVHFAE